MNTYRIRFKLRKTGTFPGSMSFMNKLLTELHKQDGQIYAWRDRDKVEWGLSKWMTVKKRTEICCRVIVDRKNWISIELQGRGKTPGPEALELGMKFANSVAEAVEALNAQSEKADARKEV